MARRWMRFGFSGFVLLFGLAGWASADDAPMSGEPIMSGQPVMAAADDGGNGGYSGNGGYGGNGGNFGYYSPTPQYWYADVEATFLKVQHHGPAAVDIDTTASPPENNFGDPSTGSLSSEYGVAPRVSVGVQLWDCWGLRAEFWSYKDSANGSSGDPALLNGVGTGNFSVGGYDFSAYTLDVEITKTWGCGPWRFEAGLGGCYAQMHQDALLAVFDSNEGTGFGSASRHINGTGLTASIEARHSLGRSGWDVFANARGSVLWGTTSGLATMSATEYFGDFSFASDAAALSNPTTLSIFEAQVGAEWTHPVKCICGTVFVRSGVEYQQWSASNAGSAVATGTAVGDLTTMTVTSTTQSPTVGLLGVSAAAGFRF